MVRRSSLIGRRAFLVAGSTTVLGVAAAWRSLSAGGLAPADVMIVEFSPAGARGKAASVPKVVKTKSQWRAQLSEAAYEVTREEGTERPFSGALLENHQAGLYSCICCDTALFNSDTKFESGTGWPSFWTPIAKENVIETTDSTLGMKRTAVSCRRCDAHLGHVFDDGPKPTGLRYCMNSVALRFAKRA